LDWITSGRLVANLSFMELEVVEEGPLIGEMVCVAPSSAVEPLQSHRRERSRLARPCRVTTSIYGGSLPCSLRTPAGGI
jgi:hypothetical protein